MLALIQEFLVVAELNNFTAAANQLLITQSALSKHMAALEEDLGVLLFLRRHRGVELTAAGKMLQKRGRDLIAQYQQLREDVSSIDLSNNKTLRVIMEPLKLPFLYNGLILFQSKYPETQLILKALPGGRSDPLPIINRKANVLFTLADQEAIKKNKHLKYFFFHKETVQIIVSTANPLSQRTEVRLEEMRDYPLLLLNAPLQDLTKNTCARLCPDFLDWAKRCERTNIRDIFFKVKTSLNWSIFPSSVINELGTGCVPLKISGFDAELTFTMCWNREDTNPNIKILKEILKESYTSDEKV